jgi:RNA polymerase sigma factor for flagellar operon FliA
MNAMNAPSVVYNRQGRFEREGWLAQHAPLVKRIAHHLLSRLPANVELDDLVQAGMIGLVDAIQRYEECQGTQFETYATQRIRGAMLDELRANDWLPRGVRRSQRRIEAAVNRLEQRLGRAPGEAEIARELELTLSEYQHLLADTRGGQLVYLDDLASRDATAEPYLDRHAVGDGGEEPGARLAERRFREALVAAIDGLPEREKLLMSLYYEEDLNFREIAAVLGVTESRVCQLHTQTVARLRARLKSA